MIHIREIKDFSIALKSEVDALELVSSDEYAIAKSFFQDFNINQPILHSILENRSAGKIFTDNKQKPSFMLVCSPAAFIFLEGDPNPISLKKIASYLKTLPQVYLISPFNWKFKTFFDGEGFTTIERIQFQGQREAFNLDLWKDKIPVSYSTHTIDQRTFPLCNWYSFILSFYGDMDHFSANGMGFCLRDQGKIISESYGLIAENKAEIGVVTDEHYRGQNLGTYVCAIMLDYCYKNNIEPFWTCNVDNPASAAIARKLGFKESFRFLQWEAPRHL